LIFNVISKTGFYFQQNRNFAGPELQGAQKVSND